MKRLLRQKAVPEQIDCGRAAELSIVLPAVERVLVKVCPIEQRALRNIAQRTCTSILTCVPSLKTQLRSSAAAFPSIRCASISRSANRRSTNARAPSSPRTALMNESVRFLRSSRPKRYLNSRSLSALKSRTLIRHHPLPASTCLLYAHYTFFPHEGQHPCAARQNRKFEPSPSAAAYSSSQCAIITEKEIHFVGNVHRKGACRTRRSGATLV